MLGCFLLSGPAGLFSFLFCLRGSLLGFFRLVGSGPLGLSSGGPVGFLLQFCHAPLDQRLKNRAAALEGVIDIPGGRPDRECGDYLDCAQDACIDAKHHGD